MNLSHHRKIKTTDVRNQFGAIVDQVAIAKEPVILLRRGRYLAAIIPMEEFRILERVIQKAEDEIDLEVARKFLADDSETIPYDKIRKELKLDEPAPSVRSRRREAAAAAAKRSETSRARKTIGARRGPASAKRR